MQVYFWVDAPAVANWLGSGRLTGASGLQSGPRLAIPSPGPLRSPEHTTPALAARAADRRDPTHDPSTAPVITQPRAARIRTALPCNGYPLDFHWFSTLLPTWSLTSVNPGVRHRSRYRTQNVSNLGTDVFMRYVSSVFRPRAGGRRLVRLRCPPEPLVCSRGTSSHDSSPPPVRFAARKHGSATMERNPIRRPPWP
jgi:hypothetical protein